MNKNNNRVRWLLGIGAVLMYMAGVSLLSSNEFNDALKVIINTLIGVFLVATSIGVEEKYKVNGLGKFSFILGLLSFVSTFIFVGSHEMFGTYFSLNGKGANLYTSFIFALIALFGYISSLRYKDFILVHVKYSGLLIALYTFMCHFSSNYLANLAVIGVIIVFLNYVKITPSINRYVKVAALFYVFFTIIFFSDIYGNIDYDLVFALIVFIINVFNICISMKNDKGIAISIIGILLFLMNTALLSSTIFAESFYGLSLILSAAVLTLFELFLNAFKVIKDDRVLIFEKIVVNLCYLSLFSDSSGLLEYGILTAIVFGMSFVNSFVYKNDKYEYNIMPLKLIFVVNTVFSFINLKVISLSDVVYYIVFDLVFLLVMYLSKNEAHRLESTVLTLYYSAMLLFLDNMAPSIYVLAGVISLLNYYVVIIRNDNSTDIRGRLYYGLLLLMLIISLNDLNMNQSKYLISSLIFGILSIVSYKDKIGFAITLPALYISLFQYIQGIVGLDESIKALVHSITNYVCFTIWIDNFGIEEIDKIRLQTISLVILSFMSLTSGYVLNTLLTIVVSVIMIYLGIKERKYNSIHNAGIVLIILSLIFLTSSLGEAKIFIYLLLIGGGIIYFVIRLISKGIPEETKEELVSAPKAKNDQDTPHNDDRKVAFCYHCGNSLKGTEKFCGKCGTKLK